MAALRAFVRPAARSSLFATPSPSATFAPAQLHHSRRWLSDQTRRRIDGLVAAKPLVLFMKGVPDMPQCGFSRATVQILDAEGVERAAYDAHNVLEDPELREGIKKYSDWATIPQVYVDGEFVGGCDIIMEMYKNGELTQLLEEKKITTPGARAKFEQDVLNS